MPRIDIDNCPLVTTSVAESACMCAGGVSGTLSLQWINHLIRGEIMGVIGKGPANMLSATGQCQVDIINPRVSAAFVCLLPEKRKKGTFEVSF